MSCHAVFCDSYLFLMVVRVCSSTSVQSTALTTATWYCAQLLGAHDGSVGSTIAVSSDDAVDDDDDGVVEAGLESEWLQAARTRTRSDAIFMADYEKHGVCRANSVMSRGRAAIDRAPTSHECPQVPGQRFASRSRIVIGWMSGNRALSSGSSRPRPLAMSRAYCICCHGGNTTVGAGSAACIRAISVPRSAIVPACSIVTGVPRIS